VSGKRLSNWKRNQYFVLMKGIYTIYKKNQEDHQEEKRDEPSQSTLNFLHQFARCYYVEKDLAPFCKNDLVLN
jgi:hypothetical protein